MTTMVRGQHRSGADLGAAAGRRNAAPGSPIVRRLDPLIQRWRVDALLRNSMYLMVATALMAGFGFLFWVLCARLFSAADVGRGTSLISATVLISYLSLLGYSNTLIRYLPGAADRDDQINTALLLVVAASLVISACYVLSLPTIAPELAFVHDTPMYALAFVAFAACSAVNLLTDAVFVACRAAKFNLVIDGLIQSLSKLALPVVLVGLGGFAVFASTGLAAGIAMIVSLLCLRRYLGFRPRPRVNSAVVREAFAFSAANYVSSVLNLAPILVVPLLVLNHLGPDRAGYFFVAFQVATLLNAVPYAVGETLLAEGAYAEATIIELGKRAARVDVIVLAPLVVAVTVGAPWLLSIFGSDYRDNATDPLKVFALGSFAVALNNLTTTLLKLTGQLGALMLSNLAYAVSICWLSAIWGDRGLTGVALAWTVGNGGSALLAVPPLLSSLVLRKRAGTPDRGDHRAGRHRITNSRPATLGTRPHDQQRSAVPSAGQPMAVDNRPFLVRAESDSEATEILRFILRVPTRQVPTRQAPTRQAPVRQAPVRQAPVRRPPVREPATQERIVGQPPYRKPPGREPPVPEPTHREPTHRAAHPPEWRPRTASMPRRRPDVGEDHPQGWTIPAGDQADSVAPRRPATQPPDDHFPASGPKREAWPVVPNAPPPAHRHGGDDLDRDDLDRTVHLPAARSRRPRS